MDHEEFWEKLNEFLTQYIHDNSQIDGVFDEDLAREVRKLIFESIEDLLQNNAELKGN